MTPARSVRVLVGLLLAGLAAGIAAPALAAGPTTPASRIAVYYGTDRVPDPRHYYGNGQIGAPRFGICEVAGATTVRPPRARPEEAFFDDLRAAVAAAPRHDVFVFVHGYNVGFVRACRRTAELAVKMRFTGVPVLWSWPSHAEPQAFTKDEALVASADVKAHLADFLFAVKARSGARAVNLIAHSLGTRAVVDALAGAADRLGPTPLFANAVLFAAAIPLDKPSAKGTGPEGDDPLDSDELEAIGDVQGARAAFLLAATRTTLYVSRHDHALRLAQIAHEGRVAMAGRGVRVIPDTETIDVSIVQRCFPTATGHSYYRTTWVIDDLSRTLAGDGAASRPYLRLETQPSLPPYWVLSRRC